MAIIQRARLDAEVTELAADKLLLDARNPRLASADNGGDQSQRRLAARLWTEMAVDELAYSIAANGYYAEEPLLVVRDDDRIGFFTVVEGNRRLVAVRLLVDNSLRAAVKATSLPVIDDAAKAQLSRLPVRIYPDRRSLWAYLGFRHINGTKPWDAFSKAKYVAEVHDVYGERLEEIAERIGDRHSTVVRLYRGLKILEQAETATSFSVEDRVKQHFAFSHLYTAVDQKEFQKFLGITPESSLRPNPVPAAKLQSLEQLVTWLYGRRSADIEPVIRSQNPDLNTLREVVSSPKGVSLLRAGRSLDAAYDASLGEERRFLDALNAASEELIVARGTATNGYDGSASALATIGSIANIANSLHDEMQAISDKRSRSRAR